MNDLPFLTVYCFVTEDKGCKESDACENGLCALQGGKKICVCNPGYKKINDVCTREGIGIHFDFHRIQYNTILCRLYPS